MTEWKKFSPIPHSSFMPRFVWAWISLFAEILLSRNEPRFNPNPKQVENLLLHSICRIPENQSYPIRINSWPPMPQITEYESSHAKTGFWNNLSNSGSVKNSVVFFIPYQKTNYKGLHIQQVYMHSGTSSSQIFCYLFSHIPEFPTYLHEQLLVTKEIVEEKYLDECTPCGYVSL